MTKAHAPFFKMLSARTRIQILRLLQQNIDLSVDDLASRLNLSITTVSRHLQLLRMHNLVTFRQEAQNRYYAVNVKEIAGRIRDFVDDLGIGLDDS